MTTMMMMVLLHQLRGTQERAGEAAWSGDRGPAGGVPEEPAREEAAVRLLLCKWSVLRVCMLLYVVVCCLLLLLLLLLYVIVCCCMLLYVVVCCCMLLYVV